MGFYLGGFLASIFIGAFLLLMGYLLDWVHRRHPIEVSAEYEPALCMVINTSNPHAPQSTKGCRTRVKYTVNGVQYNPVIEVSTEGLLKQTVWYNPNNPNDCISKQSKITMYILYGFGILFLVLSPVIGFVSKPIETTQ
jgi:hypothetical protein